MAETLIPTKSSLASKKPSPLTRLLLPDLPRSKDSSPRVSLLRSISKQSLAGMNNPASPTVKELEKRCRNINYFDLVASMRCQLIRSEHTYRLKSYSNTILGTDITQWLIASGQASNPVEVQYLATELISRGHIYNAVDDTEEEFLDSGLYRLSADDRIEVDADLIDLEQVELLLVNTRKLRTSASSDDDSSHSINTFAGDEIVDLILQKGVVTGRHDAVKLGSRMLNLDILLASDRLGNSCDLDFCDDPQTLYRLRDASAQSITVSTPRAELAVEGMPNQVVSSMALKSNVVAPTAQSGRSPAINSLKLAVFSKPPKGGDELDAETTGNETRRMTSFKRQACIKRSSSSKAVGDGIPNMNTNHGSNMNNSVVVTGLPLQAHRDLIRTTATSSSTKQAAVSRHASNDGFLLGSIPPISFDSVKAELQAAELELCYSDLFKERLASNDSGEPAGGVIPSPSSSVVSESNP